MAAVSCGLSARLANYASATYYIPCTPIAGSPGMRRTATIDRSIDRILATDRGRPACFWPGHVKRGPLATRLARFPRNFPSRANTNVAMPGPTSRVSRTTVRVVRKRPCYVTTFRPLERERAGKVRASLRNLCGYYTIVQRRRDCFVSRLRRRGTGSGTEQLIAATLSGVRFICRLWQ